VLPILLSETQVAQLMKNKHDHPDYQLTIDLAEQTVSDEQGLSIPFEVDPVRKDSLINGLDDIGLTLKHVDKIDAFEQERAATMVH